MSAFLYDLGILLLVWCAAAALFNPWLEKRTLRNVAIALFVAGTFVLFLSAQVA